MKTRKVIRIQECGPDERYFPIYDSHNTYEEGYGRKVHIMDDATGKCLCGYESHFYGVVDYEEQWGDIVGFLAQPDPGKNICQRCKQIMINALEA